MCDLGESTEVGLPALDVARDAAPITLTRLGFFGFGIVSIGAVFSSFSLSEAMWISSLPWRLVGRETDGAGLTGLGGLLEELVGIGGSGWLCEAGTVVVTAECMVG